MSLVLVFAASSLLFWLRISLASMLTAATSLTTQPILYLFCVSRLRKIVVLPVGHELV